ncbi:hypothetical protein SFC43_00345 [Bacteroides sp. CR5/BHMF/2]|nr:hypothetical protein [Bacteroides sp. CR5/BHMF/2]
MKAREKDQILSAIKNDNFDYKKAIHGEIISELERSGYVDITRTKDGSFFDITDKGETFLNDGGFSRTEKEKQRRSAKNMLYESHFLY